MFFSIFYHKGKGAACQDFFGKTFEELQTIDGGKNRKIAEGFEKSIKELINSSEDWNIGY